MNADRPDALDRAIDEVARGLVNAPPDREMASRIAAALPPRRAPWFVMTPRWAVHMVGAASLAVVMLALWSGREPAVPAPATAAAPTVPAAPMTALVRWSEAGAVRPRVAAAAAGRSRAPVAPSDHERALAPVTDPGQIAVVALEAGAIEIAPAVLEPLTIDALVDGGAPPILKE